MSYSGEKPGGERRRPRLQFALRREDWAPLPEAVMSDLSDWARVGSWIPHTDELRSTLILNTFTNAALAVVGVTYHKRAMEWGKSLGTSDLVSRSFAYHLNRRRHMIFDRAGAPRPGVLALYGLGLVAGSMTLAAEHLGKLPILYALPSVEAEPEPVSVAEGSEVLSELHPEFPDVVFNTAYKLDPGNVEAPVELFTGAVDTFRMIMSNFDAQEAYEAGDQL